MKHLKLTDDELDLIASAISFTLRERENVTGDRAPAFKRALNKLNEKVWKKIRAKR